MQMNRKGFAYSCWTTTSATLESEVTNLPQRVM